MSDKLNPHFDDSPFNPDSFQKHVEELLSEAKSGGQRFGILKIQSANEVMKQAAMKPIPNMLFDEFWFEGELCVLFADTGVGKSILAVQIAESIASGNAIPGFRLEAEPQPVYYFDFELSDKQFQKRYSDNYKSNYTFSEDLKRGEMTSDDIPDGVSFDTYLNQCFEEAISTTGAKVIIIDNLTRLRNTDTDQARDAKPLMEYLMKLKSKYGVSLLALEHTRKRDESRGITLNDLQGSAMKSRFMDSAISIGRSVQDKNVRYIKQMKCRHGEFRFDSENVAVCEIANPDNFTRFGFLDFGTEREHLRQPSETERSELETTVKDMLEADPTLTAYAIAKKLCPDESKFNSFKVKISRIVKRISNT